MGKWKESILDNIALINPTESLGKGIPAKKVAMEVLQPFTKKVPSYSIEAYNGGMKFRNGDTIVARITPCLENGKTAYIDFLDHNEVGFGSTEYIVIRERKGISDKGFLYYFLISQEFRNVAILSMTGSSGRQRVQTDVVRNHTFLLPPLPEQKAIASVLSSLDDKIGLLHRQNKTLETMAEALFRQWFVPARAGEPHAGGEEVQGDWGNGCLRDIVDINPSYKLEKGKPAPYLEMSNVSNATFNPERWYMRKFTSGMKFQNEDTLLARITPCLENGKTCFVTFLKDKEIGWGSTEYIIMRMRKPFHPFISYVLAKDKDFRDFAISSMSGSSGRQRAQADVLKEYEIKIPPLEIIEEINTQLEGILPRLIINANQVYTLEKLRDNLLPKLMSGEVRIEF